MDINDFLQNPIMVKICSSLVKNKKPMSITELYKKNTGMIGAYTSYSKKSNWLESLGIVYIEKKGKTKYLTLTSKGKKFANLLIRADNVLQENGGS
jgi:predicted transcriptional regulator